MPQDEPQFMQCMEVWGGSETTSRSVRLGGLDAWVYSRPFGNAGAGGDVYYASSCATGRINRLLLADVSGHGDAVAASALTLRKLMRQYVNYLDQTQFVRSLNEQFSELSRQGKFATAITTTFFSPNRVLTVCNAGHPPPLFYSHLQKKWFILEQPRVEGETVRNIPLGISQVMDYEQFHVVLDIGDLVLCYTDALVESRDRDGEMLGTAGLLRIVESIAAAPADLIGSLLDELSGRFRGNLLEDDVTVLLLRPSATARKFAFGQQLLGAARVMGAVMRLALPNAERPPLPDLRFANVVGDLLPPLQKRWRPKAPKWSGARPPAS